MQRRAAAILFVLSVFALLPRTAEAGGPEFPAGGTRSLGRGGAGFARADDPSLMARNPALLADLWDDQAMLGAHLLLAKACMQLTGGYGWGTTGNADVSNFGDGPLVLNPPLGARDLNGKLLKNYADEPYPNVCYQGPAPFLPQVAVAMKLSPDLGVGFGFFPPDTDSLSQWGNADGTIDTPNGKRPNPLRFDSIGTLQSVSFFTMMGALGYRLADWIRIGGGFQWNVVAYHSRSWTVLQPNQFDPRNNIQADTFGRDLFVPGVIASIQLKPIDSLDIAVGFKWSDHVQNNAKLDLTAGAFGTGKVYQYQDPMGMVRTLGTSIPAVTNNQRILVKAPPVWVPQLSVGVRFADRLKPPPADRAKARELGGGVVEDHMLTERWDLELDAIYYFNSQFDATYVTATGANLTIPQLGADGTVTPSSEFAVGKCPVPLVNNKCPSAARTLKFPYGGKNQISARFGGDYNIFPGILAVRAGVSYETDGQKVELLEVANYMLSRIGVHGGLTLRVAGKTDISFGFAHFIQKHVHLQVNDTQAQYPSKYKTADYHFQPGLGVKDMMGNEVPAKNGFDGVAMQEVPNGSAARLATEIGPNYVNAGRYYMNLEVFSLAFTQHF
jgi:hypothetical protein